ncbi:hypothetical protein STANM309S_03160 [Streptomyces tanashiensis]
MLGTAPAGAADTWQQVGTDSRSGVSGLAYEGRTEDGDGVNALVVHDNKKSGQPRLSRITYTESSTVIAPLAWDGAEPVDLEAVEPIPGMPGEYLAVTGRGILYRVKVVDTTATVVDYTPLPAIAEGDDFESFALVARGGMFAALWADRGAGAGRPWPPCTRRRCRSRRGGSLCSAPSRSGPTVSSRLVAAPRHISDITGRPARSTVLAVSSVLAAAALAVPAQAEDHHRASRAVRCPS